MKDTFAVEDCFSAASFTQNFAPFFLCGVGYGSSYVFGFFLCEVKFITYFTGVAAAKIIGPHAVLRGSDFITWKGQDGPVQSMHVYGTHKPACTWLVLAAS